MDGKKYNQIIRTILTEADENDLNFISKAIVYRREELHKINIKFEEFVR